MARKSKIFKVNRKSVSVGFGPFRTNVGAKGVRYSAKLPGGQRVQKTVGWNSGSGSGSRAASQSATAVPATPTEPMFKTTSAKWIGYPGCALAIISVLAMCGDFTTGVVMFMFAAALGTWARRIDRKAVASDVIEIDAVSGDESASEAESPEATAE